MSTNYTLQCKKGQCEVVTAYKTDDDYNISNIQTQWLSRQDLYAESNFGAAPDDMDGYYTNGRQINDYLRRN